MNSRLPTSKLIAAVRTQEDLEQVLRLNIESVFLLFSDLCLLEEQCRQLYQANKKVFLHLDLVNGLKGDASGVRYASRSFRLTGIISTKPACVRLAREAGLIAILRVFMLDSAALKTGALHAQACRPDYVEIMPGVATQIIRRCQPIFKAPLIAGGLIETKEDIAEALAAGATAVSTSARHLWSSYQA